MHSNVYIFEESLIITVDSKIRKIPPYDKEFWIEQYITKEKSIKEIATEFKFCIGTTRRRIKRYKLLRTLSEAAKGRRNSQWKGNKVQHRALHSWIRDRLPQPKHCTRCKKHYNLLDLANISQDYKREVSDWEYLCRRCHMIKDGRIKKDK